MLYWNNLNDEMDYVVDLVQFSTGERFLHFRLPKDSPHEHTAISTKAYAGAILKMFFSGRLFFSVVETTDGRLFGVDSHGLWLLKEEADYHNHRIRFSQEVEPCRGTPPPWVNGIPPQFAPK